MQQVGRQDGSGTGNLEETAREMATQLTRVFQKHDEKQRSEAIEACKDVDRLCFQHLPEETITVGATAFVDALWAKDDVEFDYLRGGGLDKRGLDRADWSPVRQQFRKRAAAFDIDQEYAEYKTTGWRRHKTGGDYLTPFQQAQVLELRAALQDPEYPHKPKYGQSGPGPEAIRYTLGVELHDMHTPHHWKQARDAMTPYFLRILTEHTSHDDPETHISDA